MLGSIVVATSLHWPLRLPEGDRVSLVPAVMAVLALLWRWPAALALFAVCALSLMPWPATSPWHLLALGASGVLAGEALRRGVRPLTAATLLLAVSLPFEVANATAQPMHGALRLLTPALVQAGLAVALGCLVMTVLPRRSPLFAPRARSGWSQLLFAACVGSASLAALIAQPAAAVIGGMLLGGATAWWLARSGHQPLELTRPQVSLRRRTAALERGAGRQRRQLQELRQSEQQRLEDLQAAQRLLRDRAQATVNAARAADLANTRWQTLMAGSTEGALFTDERGIVQAVNPAAAALLGRPVADLLGTPVRSLIPRDHVTEHPLDLPASTPRREARWESATIQTDRADREVLLQVETFTVHGATHHLIRMSGSSSGPGSRSVAQEPEHPRDFFIASMSHELRTPLHGLIATLDMLRANPSTSDEVQHQLSIARSSARALLKIANDVLDLARIKSSLFALERRHFSMTTLLREVVEEASARASSLGLDLSTEIAGVLPPSFHGDPARIKQILGNLVSNALKFTIAGGVIVRVRYADGQCVIDVCDSGPGIPPENRVRIFDAFVRLDAGGGTRIGGSGLGLPISRRLAEAMKGQLVLAHSGPRGSTFRVTLPLEASDEAPPEDQTQRILRNPRGRILVVEDNPTNRYVAQAMLAGLECPATIAESGEEALQLLDQQEFDLILMDCQMPGMDGYETTRRVRRQLLTHIPIIAMTANAMSDDRSHCIAAGMDDFLAKPFDRQTLNALLCRWLPASTSLAAHDGDVPGEQDTRIDLHPDLDIGVLNELRESLHWKSEPMERIRASFTDTMEKLLFQLEQPETDREHLLRSLHTVLGSAGMVGARQLEFLARQVQRAVREGRQDAVREAADYLRDGMRRYLREFERRMNLGADTDRMPRLKR